MSGWFGATLRLSVVLLAVSIGYVGPAWADCLQSGTTVTCSGVSPGGFNAGAQNGLAVTVQSGAAVSNPGSIVITLNNNNMVTNLGSISVDPSFSGISGGTGNQVTSGGTIT